MAKMASEDAVSREIPEDAVEVVETPKAPVEEGCPCAPGYCQTCGKSK